MAFAGVGVKGHGAWCPASSVTPSSLIEFGYASVPQSIPAHLSKGPRLWRCLEMDAPTGQVNYEVKEPCNHDGTCALSTIADLMGDGIMLIVYVSVLTLPSIHKMLYYPVHIRQLREVGARGKLSS